VGDGIPHSTSAVASWGFFFCDVLAHSSRFGSDKELARLGKVSSTKVGLLNSRARYKKYIKYDIYMSFFTVVESIFGFYWFLSN